MALGRDSAYLEDRGAAVQELKAALRRVDPASGQNGKSGQSAGNGGHGSQGDGSDGCACRRRDTDGQHAGPRLMAPDHHDVMAACTGQSLGFLVSVQDT